MGGILGDHIVHWSCVKRLARYFSRDSRYLCVFLRSGLEVNKDVLAFLYLVSTFVVDNLKFTSVHNKTIHVGEKRHRPASLQGCENGVLYRVVDHDFKLEAMFLYYKSMVLFGS